MWLHIDAAWAGVALACPEYREPLRLAGINEYADSYCTNFHKVCLQILLTIASEADDDQWGLVNFDSSTLWVRDRKHLTDALDVTPEFLRTKQGDAGRIFWFIFDIDYSIYFV